MRITEIVKRLQYLHEQVGSELDLTMLELDPYTNKLKIRYVVIDPKEDGGE